jgi:hypothetical protein
MHFLRTDVNPISQFTIDYTTGPFQFLMTSALLILSLASFALAIGLYQGISGPARSQIGIMFLGLWAVGLLIAGLAPMDSPDEPRTVAGTIAQLNGPLHVLSLVIGAILISRRFQYDERWRQLYSPAFFLSLVMLVEFIGVFITLATQSGIAGLSQRIFIATTLAWLSLTGMFLRSSAVNNS